MVARIAVGTFAVIATVFSFFVTYFAVTYAGSSGCEDYMIECRDARPALALAYLLAGTLLIGSLLYIGYLALVDRLQLSETTRATVLLGASILAFLMLRVLLA